MGYRTLCQCVDDLANTRQLIRIETEIDPVLEAAEIHRRVFEAGGPAIYFSRVKGSPFPMVSNLLGTRARMHYIFRDTLDTVRQLVQLKIDPGAVLRRPWQLWRAPWAALTTLPKRVSTGPIMSNTTTINQLPQLKCWPNDGGAFITLPQVYTESPATPGWRHSNLGMYRVQLSGNKYETNREIGLHYQIHRGIGVHHSEAIARGESLPANIFVGGTPAMTVAAVMPLPEGLPELSFAGALAGHRIPLVQTQPGSLPIYAESDFCITGRIARDRQLPEGPFGDHLGYYSLEHDFPVMEVDRVYHRPGAIWPFTVVGRPPQEDTMLGEIIHELTGPVIPTLIAGVRAVHAVDAAGVHPLLLAIGSERYVPYARSDAPQELLTQANAILGQGQMSLAKYLLIVAGEDCPALRIDDIGAYLRHLLARVDWRRDLHFQTCTTIDTLDYSGTGLNEGSKVVIAAVGPARRDLPKEITGELRLPQGFKDPKLALPGVLIVQGPPSTAARGSADESLARFVAHYRADEPINQFPLIVLADDSAFSAQSLGNFLWTTFTRSNPAADIDGIQSSIVNKHWGCAGSLVIDARRKPHFPPPLVEDPAVSQRVDALAVRGGPLEGLF